MCWRKRRAEPQNSDATFSGASRQQRDLCGSGPSFCFLAEHSCWLFSLCIFKTFGKFFNAATFTIFSFSKSSTVLLINLWGIGLTALKAQLYCECLKHIFKAKSQNFTLDYHFILADDIFSFAQRMPLCRTRAVQPSYTL